MLHSTQSKCLVFCLQRSLLPLMEATWNNQFPYFLIQINKNNNSNSINTFIQLLLSLLSHPTRQQILQNVFIQQIKFYVKIDSIWNVISVGIRQSQKIVMFFESVIKKKQGILTTVSPRYDSRATKKQIFVNNFPNNQQHNLEQNILSINRSKSSKELNNGNFLSLHLKHPILTKQKTNYRSVALFQNQQTSLQQKQDNNFRSNQQLCQKHRRNYDIKQIQSKGCFDSNEYELKNLKKTNSNKILRTSREFNGDSSAFNSYQSSKLKQPHSSAYSSVKNFQLTNSIKKKPNTQNPVLSPFCLQKQMNQYYEQDTTKITHMDTDSTQLRATIKNLQRQIRSTNQQRQIDRSKILQYSINMDKLKFQNDCLKRNAYNSKQNIDSKKEKQKNQLHQIKKILKQEVQNKQQLQRQRQNILNQLNEALINHESEKNKWESQKKIMQNKIDTLLIEVKQKKNQNLLHAQKSNSICQQNKKLRSTIQNLTHKVQQKQNQNKWMGSKVNQMKQALQHIKSHGNTRIQKLQDQLIQIQIKKKDHTYTHINQIKQLEATIQQKLAIISQLNRQLQIKNSILSNANKQIHSLKNTLSQKQASSANLHLTLTQQISRLKEEIKQYESKINENMDIYKKYEISSQTHDQQLQEKNKIIHALAKNVSECNNVIDGLKKEKAVLEKFKIQYQAKINEEINTINKLNQQNTDLKSQIQQLFRKRLQKQKQLSQATNNYKKQQIKLSQTQQQRDNLHKQLQRYKSICTTITEQKRTKDIQIYNIKKQISELKDEKQKIIKQRDQLRKIQQFKQNSYITLHKQHENIKKQLLQHKYKNQCQARDLQTKQKAIQQNNAKTKSLQQQISKISALLDEKQQEIQSLKQYTSKLDKKPQRISSQLTNASVTSSIQSTNSYTQLQMKLCSVLGIFLTSNIDKIVGPVEQMFKNKRSLQIYYKNYEQLLKIFDIKQNHNRLISQMRQYKNNYSRILDINQRQQNDIKRLKEENNYLLDRTQQASITFKKLQLMLEESNESVIRLGLKNFNEKFTITGTKKY